MDRERKPDARRLLVVGHEAERTGATLFLLDLLRSMQERSRRLRFSVLLREGGDLTREFTALAPTYVQEELGSHRLRRQLANGALAEHASVDRLVADADVVLAHSIASHELLGRVAAPQVALFSYVHELGWETESNHFPVTLTNFNRQWFVAGSAVVRAYLWNRWGIRDRVLTLHNGIDVKRTAVDAAAVDRVHTRALAGATGEQKLFVTCGPLGWRKGGDLVPLLVRALIDASPQNAAPDFHYLWFGRLNDPMHAQVRYDLASLDLEAFVTILPRLPEPVKFFAAADVYLLTSREEPFSRSLLEVAASGRPAVAFEQGGVDELKPYYRGLRSVPYLDLAAFATSAWEAARDLGPSGFTAEGECHFDIQRVADELLTYLQLPPGGLANGI